MLSSLPAAAARTITGREFFPDLISGPFHHGLVVVFAVAAGLAAIAALASALRGGRYVQPAAADGSALPTTAALPMGAALPVSTTPIAEDRGRSEDSSRFHDIAAAPRNRASPQRKNTMALTTMDAKPALVVIDLRNGILAVPTVHPVDEIVPRAASLAAAFRCHGLPVVLVSVAGRAPARTEASRSDGYTPAPHWADLVEEPQPQPDDHRVTKQRWGALHGTSLEAHLKDLGVTQIVLAGIAASVGVESTARSAYEHGFHVVLATDATTDGDAAAHQGRIERIFPKLGETATATEILDMLENTR